MKSENKRGLQIKEGKVWVVRIVFKSEVVASKKSHTTQKTERKRKQESTKKNE